MFYTISATEGEVVHLKLVSAPSNSGSKAVVLLWFSVARFGVRVSVTFHLACGSVWVTVWPLLGK